MAIAHSIQVKKYGRITSAIEISASPSKISIKASYGEVCGVNPTSLSKEKSVIFPAEFFNTYLLTTPPSE